MTPRSWHFSSQLPAMLQSHHPVMLHPSATLYPSQCFILPDTFGDAAPPPSQFLCFFLCLFCQLSFFFFFFLYLLAHWVFSILLGFRGFLLIPPPFELGFLEFLYLAAFHGSLIVWMFRKKKKKTKTKTKNKKQKKKKKKKVQNSLFRVVSARFIRCAYISTYASYRKWKKS